MIRTASSHQVRDKVNSSSIGKWINYKNELKDLLNELNTDSFYDQKRACSSAAEHYGDIVGVVGSINHAHHFN